MLERQRLILGPWQPPAGRPKPLTRAAAPAPPAGRWRNILDRDTGQRLGGVRSRTVKVVPLLPWLARRVWEVLETEDESLLLSLYGPWGLFKPWEVRDAEDRLVCTVSGGLVLDSAGQLRARPGAAAEPPRRCFVSADGEELACFRPVAAGIELAFTPLVQEDPYAKMALLGATLALCEELRLQKAS
jgi:hypothetical protein